MKFKNVTDSFLFPAGSLIGDDAGTIVRKPDESDDDYQARSNELRQKLAESSAIRAANAQAVLDGKDQQPEVVGLAELQAALNPERVAKYRAVGAELPSDLVRVNMTLGTLVFDLFTATAVAPTAPLAAALFSKKVQNLATKVQKDEFEVDDSVVAQLRPALEDEKLWEKVNLSVYTLVRGQKSYIPVNHNAAGFFPNVMNAAVNIFVPAEASDAQVEAPQA